MNITLKNSDPVHAIITVAVAKEDYLPEVEKALNDIRKNIVIAGFRKGYAPKSRIQSLYGTPTMSDKINKIVTDELSEYIQNNKLNLLGKPLLVTPENLTMNFEDQQDYEFSFEVGLTPEMVIRLTKDDVLPYYIVALSDKELDEQVQRYQVNYGDFVTAEVVEAKDLVKGSLVEIGGSLAHEEAALMPSYMKSAEERAKFIGAKVGDAIIFNPFLAYEGKEVELASFLKVQKEDLADHRGDFTLTIEEIKRYQQSAMDQKFFDQVFEPGTVTSPEAFCEKVRERFIEQMKPQCDARFLFDVRKLVVDKANGIQFPDDFLKRWLLASDETYTQEMAEEEYPTILDDLKFRLVKDRFVQENHIRASDAEVEQEAINTVVTRFIHYGVTEIPQNIVHNCVRELLANEKSIDKLVNQVLDQKVLEAFKDLVTLQPQEVSMDEWTRLMETQPKEEII
jgi:trigger factor